MPASTPSDPVTVLDGGLSTALEELGADLSSSLWTARLLSEAPHLIAAAHRAYFDAGAQVAIAASYQASVPGLVAAGFDEAEAARLIASSVTIAQEVRDEVVATEAAKDPDFKRTWESLTAFRANYAIWREHGYME